MVVGLIMDFEDALVEIRATERRLIQRGPFRSCAKKEVLRIKQQLRVHLLTDGERFEFNSVLRRIVAYGGVLKGLTPL
jgi:hypothetical protein